MPPTGAGPPEAAAPGSPGSSPYRTSLALGCPFCSRRRSRRHGQLGHMTSPDIEAAEQFLAANARVLERRRFERLFRSGDAGPVRDAVAAYRNPDGGFGHALEPDGRCPGSQPLAIDFALRVLLEAGA